jgi:hypothetical protein
MSTTPAGLPAWSRTADASVYGGHVDKRDFEGQGPVNPQTDVSAAQFIRLAADVAALSRVAPFAVLTIQCNDTVPAAPTVVRAQQMTAVSLAGYEGASPTGDFPTLTRVSDGVFDVVWPTSVADDYGVEQAVDLVHAHASLQNGSAYSSVRPTRLSAISWRFAAQDDSGTPIDDALVTIKVG